MDAMSSRRLPRRGGKKGPTALVKREASMMTAVYGVTKYKWGGGKENREIIRYV